MKNYYQILGLQPAADQKAIRKGWLKKAKLLHPDHNQDDPTAEEQFKEIQEAYRILSDPFLRSRYDLGGFNSLVTSPPENHTINHYFYSHAKSVFAKQYEEVAITFTYTGQGRVFKRPAFNDFFITGSPYVSHRLIVHEGNNLKETTFTYLVCPLKQGKIEISTASIRISNKDFFSESLSISVSPNRCHFTDDETADGKPLKFLLHYSLQMDITSDLKKNHTLLIPRSKTAYMFHSIGMTMKIVFFIWGGIMCGFYIDIPFLLGCLIGSFLGGVNCMIMYKLVGVKSKFYHSLKYEPVVEYLENGYKPGESTGIPLLKTNIFYTFQKLLF